MNPVNDWPDKLSQPARRALANSGYTQLDQLTKVKESELLALHGMGPKGVRMLREELASRGLSFGN